MDAQKLLLKIGLYIVFEYKNRKKTGISVNVKNRKTKKILSLHL